MFGQAFKTERSCISENSSSLKPDALCVILFHPFCSSPSHMTSLCGASGYCQDNVPPSFYPALGALFSTFPLEPFAAALCSRSTRTCGAAALGCGVPKPLVWKQKSTCNLVDAHASGDPEKKSTVDLERRKFTVFTPRTCRH